MRAAAVDFDFMCSVNRRSAAPICSQDGGIMVDVGERIICEADCVVCGNEFKPTEPDGDAEMIACVLRGYAEVCPNEDSPDQTVCVLENIKFSRMICGKCFMEDEELCRFFNKLGLRVR